MKLWEEYIQREFIDPGTADAITQVAGGGTKARLAVNLGLKAINYLKSKLPRARTPEEKEQIQRQIQQKQQQVAQQKQRM